MRSADNRAVRAAAFRSAADAIERGDRIESADADRVIDTLLAFKGPDPKKLRKMILRRYWAKFYAGVPRCTAAYLIAADWLKARRSGFIEPGSQDEFFQRLEQLGFSRRKARTIANDLDFEL